jgi:Domain of unknown function (DUF4124)
MWGTFGLVTFHCGDILLKLTFTTSALVLATTLLTLSSFHASADKTVYRWKDDAGNQVNSDRPPPQGTEYEVISTSSSMVREVEEESTIPLEVKPGASKDSEQVTTDKPKIEKNPEYCQQARDNLQTLDTHARIRIPNDQGEYRYIDEAEKEEQRKLATETIAIHCEPSN